MAAEGFTVEPADLPYLDLIIKQLKEKKTVRRVLNNDETVVRSCILCGEVRFVNTSADVGKFTSCQILQGCLCGDESDNSIMLEANWVNSWTLKREYKENPKLLPPEIFRDPELEKDGLSGWKRPYISTAKPQRQGETEQETLELIERVERKGVPEIPVEARLINETLGEKDYLRVVNQ